MRLDFVLGEVEDLLKETNEKLSNIEKLLELHLTPPDLKHYIKWKEEKRKSLSD